MIDTVLVQLEAMRAQLAAMQAQFEAIAYVLQIDLVTAQETQASCPHSETEEVGTFGAPEIVCKACGAHV